MYMNLSSSFEIKYMKGLFFKGHVYDWCWFQNTGSHTHTKIPPESPPTQPLEIEPLVFESVLV